MPENKAALSVKSHDPRIDEFMEQVKKLTLPIFYGNIIITVQAGAPVLVTFENKIKV